MALQFETLEELNDYIEFLQLKSKPIPMNISSERWLQTIHL